MKRLLKQLEQASSLGEHFLPRLQEALVLRFHHQIPLVPTV